VAGMEMSGTHSGDDLTNVQYKPIWNCYYESPPYGEYILIKKIIDVWISLFYKLYICVISVFHSVKWCNVFNDKDN
jgi:hypothetical protein